MPPPNLPKNWPVLAIAVCVILLAILAWLQFAWTAQLSHAQEAMARSALSNSIQQLQQVIDRELTNLLAAFRRQGRSRSADQWDRYAANYTAWTQAAPFPQVLSQILFYAADEEDRWRLWELPLEGGLPARAEWAPEADNLRIALGAAIGGSERARSPRGPVWTIYPRARALVRPEVGLPALTDRQGRQTRLPWRGFVILVMDWDYIRGTLLPEVVGRLFSGPDGEQIFCLALLAGRSDESGEFLYRSDPEVGAEWLAGVDLRRRLRLRLLRPPGSAGAQSVRPPQPRIILASGAPLPPVEVAATHVSGPVAEVVARQRARSLSTGLGVLLVLAGALALVALSARRAEQLAALQVQFVAGVTHELRTPLSVIRSVGENLADGVVVADKHVRRYGELIRDQGRRLSEMVEQTLQFAALESGKRKFHSVPLDPAEAVTEAVELARHTIDEAGFTLEVVEGGPLRPVIADRDAVQQILANLLSNAVKYGEPGRWIRVETGLENGRARSEVWVRVSDGGIGVPAKESRRIFDAYYRGAAMSDGSVQGSGLGLKLARDLACGMGGDLSCRSEPGKGSAFTLRLPAQSEAAT